MFFEQLKKACDMRNITVTAVTAQLNMSKSNVTNWKNGTMPNGEVLVRLSELLKVSTDFLLKGDRAEPIKTDNSVRSGDMTNSKIVTGYKNHYITDDNTPTEAMYSGIFKRLDNLSETQCYRAIADIIELLDEKYQVE